MEETKKCMFCQSDIPKKAIVCHVCRRRQAVKLSGPAILIVILLCIALACVIVFANETSPKNYITLEEFEKIETGMSYNDIVDIVGCEPKVLSESEIMGIKSTMYMYYGKDHISNANITVQDGKVKSKSQLGLR